MQLINIGILQCLNVNEVCAGVGCLKAFFKKQDFFSCYRDVPVRLTAYFSCNGCPNRQPLAPGQDPGMIEKLDRLTLEKVTVVHVGACRNLNEGRGQECSRMTTIIQLLEAREIKVIRGTHREPTPCN